MKKALLMSLFLILLILIPRMLTAQELVTLTDIYGTVIKFSTFETNIEEQEGFLKRYYGVHEIYRNPNLMPIKQDNQVYYFISFTKINEYLFDNNKARITLTNGEQVVGYPLPECILKGMSPLGEISVPQQKVKEMKFNQISISNKLKFEQPYESELRGTVHLISGEVLSLDNVSLVYRKTRLDERYLPAKTVRNWYRTNEIPLILLSEQGIKAIQEGKDDIGERRKPVAFIGDTIIGFMHVPFEIIKSIQLTSVK